MTDNFLLQKLKLLNNNLDIICRGFYLKLIILILGALILFPASIFADSNFVFSTDVQNIGIGEISGPITIHANIPVSETTYITLTTTSGTGQFYSSKTSTEPILSGSYIYISTGNSNRTFYYKDSIAGNFVLTANIFSKDKTQNLATISQNISIGQLSNTNTDSGANTEIETSNLDENTNSSGSNSSAHSSPVSLSDDKTKMDFEISAGRDRLTSVGSSVVFKATATKLQNVSGENITYLWSFGDGTSSLGNPVSHTYRFSGEYTVVVNGTFSDKQAVSRAVVKVIEPKISIDKIDGGIEVINNSGAEINLEGWKMLGLSRSFNFPKDTLVPNNKKIVIPDEISGINGGDIVLENPLNRKYGEILPEQITSQSQYSIGDIEKEIKKVSNDLNIISGQASEITNSVVFQNEVKNESHEQKINPNISSDIAPEKIEEAIGGSDNFATVFEAPKSTSFVNKVFAWPIKGFEFIKSIFSD